MLVSRTVRLSDDVVDFSKATESCIIVATSENVLLYSTFGVSVSEMEAESVRMRFTAMTYEALSVMETVSLPLAPNSRVIESVMEMVST